MVKKVAIVSLGGTISSRYDPGSKSMKAAADAADLVEMLPERNLGSELTLENFAKILSFNLNFDTLVRLADRLSGLLSLNEYTGAVITQGTDTLEESSYLLDLILQVEKPVVLTGAQLPADHPQSDGPRNLADAILAASSPEMRNCGVLVCFNGTVHAARDVAKLHTSALESFSSLGHGGLGVVDQGSVIRYRAPLIRAHYEVSEIQATVPLLKLVMDSDLVALKAIASSAVDGLVVEGFGRGNVTEAYAQELRILSDSGLPVVVTSRCAAGRVKPIYGSGGGGRELQDLGVIFAGDLRGPKARLLLCVLLSAGLSREEIRAEFMRNAP